MNYLVYDVVIPARNEEKYLKSTLISIKKQSLPPNRIIVVNDGSTDGTSEIASSIADVVVNLKDRGYSALGTADIPKTFNKGLERVAPEANYVMICGADALLPGNYVGTILSEMKRDPKLVIASGGLDEDPDYGEALPRGTRVVRTDFWRSVNGLKYPVTLGWESWLVYKALQLEFNVKRIQYLKIRSQRHPIRGALRRAYSKGIAMRLLGYTWKSAIARAFRYFLLNPNAGVEMISGYIYARRMHVLDVASWVKKNQNEQFPNKIRFYISHIFKRTKF